MIVPQKNPYEFKCPECHTRIPLPTKLTFTLPNGSPRCIIKRSAGSHSCVNCATLYRFFKIWDHGTVKLEVYEDGTLEPLFVRIYKKGIAK